MKKLSSKFVSLLSLFVLLAVWGFAQQATHFTENAQKKADSVPGSEIDSPVGQKAKPSNTPANSTATTGNPVKSTFMFGDEKNIYSPATEMRAIWIPRGAYRKPEDIKKIVFNCANYNINTLIFQVRGNGTVSGRLTFHSLARRALICIMSLSL